MASITPCGNKRLAQARTRQGFALIFAESYAFGFITTYQSNTQ